MPPPPFYNPGSTTAAMSHFNHEEYDGELSSISPVSSIASLRVLASPLVSIKKTCLVSNHNRVPRVLGRNGGNAKVFQKVLSKGKT